MLNWRRDPGYEQRMKQLRSETDQLRSETEQLRSETERLRRENAKQRALSALIRQHCFPDESNSTPLPPTEPDSGSS